MGHACSPKTFQRVVQSLGYHKHIARRKFNVRPDNRPRRVQWAQEHLSRTYEEWKRVLWTDGSSFSTAGFGHRPWVIPSPEEEYHLDCIDEVFNQGRQSKMVWGGFCGGTKSELVFVPGRATLDSAAYVTTVMEPHLVPLWHRCCEEYGWRMAHQTTGVIPKNTRS